MKFGLAFASSVGIEGNDLFFVVKKRALHRAVVGAEKDFGDNDGVFIHRLETHLQDRNFRIADTLDADEVEK